MHAKILLNKESARNSVGEYKQLATAIIHAYALNEKTLSSSSFSPEKIINHSNIRCALQVFPENFQTDFCNWFGQLSTGELKAYSLDNKISSNGFNLLGEQLFTQSEAKEKGAIFTPDWLARRVAYEAFRSWKRLNAGKGIPQLAGDLSCGTGVFLSELRRLLSSETKIIGVDSCPEYAALSRLALAGEKNCIVECRDTLVDSHTSIPTLFSEETGDARVAAPVDGYDLIVGNPPYIRSQLLKAEYAGQLKKLYPKYTKGNFDLLVLFIAQTLSALAPGGVGSLIVSSKFLNTKYGEEICRHLAESARILEIVDFGDGQLFAEKTTYVCVITFAKLPPTGPVKISKYPPGLIWSENEPYFHLEETITVPLERLQSTPWNLSEGSQDDILRQMQNPKFPSLLDVFTQVSQGVRTGANNVFVIKNGRSELIERELLRPYASGENIRRCQITSTDKYLLWLYRINGDNGRLAALPSSEIESEYPRAWAYLQNSRQELSERDLEKGAPWYGYSRTQNLELQHSPKILVREMMPWAEFAADPTGSYNICSGYALVPPPEMSAEDLNMWAAILSTPTIEFQLRLISTQLHSGWFRLLVHHLKRLRLPLLSKEHSKAALSLSISIAGNLFDDNLWNLMDEIVANSFGLTREMRGQIKDYLKPFHQISRPQRRKFAFEPDEQTQEGVDDTKFDESVTADAETGEQSQTNADIGNTNDLTFDQKQKYIPVELPQFYPLHRNRGNLRRLVTFQPNKTAPVHRWYKYVQGYSGELVENLLDEFSATRKSVVYDPFVGSGTTLLVCRQKGIASFGAEISPFTSWIARLKTYPWSASEIKDLTETVRAARVPAEKSELLFQSFFEKAYAPEIFGQIVGWRNWVVNQNFAPHLRDFILLALVSVLEDLSQIRKHGSHYRYLNKDNVGTNRLNIATIDSSSDVKPILLKQLELMSADVEVTRFARPLAECEVFNINVTSQAPEGRRASHVITSPPYLNRNNYIAQQKGELSLTGLVADYQEYRDLVRNSFKSHVQSDSGKHTVTDIPGVQKILDAIELT